MLYFENFKVMGKKKSSNFSVYKTRVFEIICRWKFFCRKENKGHIWVQINFKISGTFLKRQYDTKILGLYCKTSGVLDEKNHGSLNLQITCKKIIFYKILS
jgi:hypothetical protein